MRAPLRSFRTPPFAIHTVHSISIRRRATVPCCLPLLFLEIPTSTTAPALQRVLSLDVDVHQVRKYLRRHPNTQKRTLRGHAITLHTISTTIAMSSAKRPTLLRETTSRRVGGSLSPSATSTSGQRGGHGGYSSSSGSSGSSSQEDEGSSGLLSVRTNNISYL